MKVERVCISVTPSFHKLMKEVSEVYGIGSISALIKIAVYDFINARTAGGVLTLENGTDRKN